MQPRTKVNGGRTTPPPQKKPHTKQNATPQHTNPTHKLHTSQLRNLKAGSVRSAEEGGRGNMVYLHNEGMELDA